MQLEEFRKKKEAALAAKQRQASTLAVSSASDQSAAPSAHPAATSSSSQNGQDVEKYKEEAQALKDQVAQLLESVDGLHRALNDERYNSTQLEEQLREFRESKAAAEAVAIDGVAAAADAAALVAELEESRASASRYATAAETASSELEHANERVQNLQKELDSAQAALGSVVDLAAQLAEKEQAFQEIEEELAHQRELNHKMKEELVEQAAAAEDAVAAEEAEVAKEIQLTNQISQLESSLESTRQELSSAVMLATERQSEVERLQAQVTDAKEAAAGMELAAEQQSLLEELEAELTSTRDESIGLRGQLEALERELTERADHEAAMRDQIEALKVAAAEATARAQAVDLSVVDSREEQLANLQAERDALLEDLQATSTMASEAQSKVAELQQAVEAAQAEAAAKTEEALVAATALETSTSGTSNELNILRAKAEASHMRIADLEGQLAEAYDAINNAEYKSKQLSDELKTLMAQTEQVLVEKAAAESAKEEAIAAMVQLQTQLAAGAGADVAEAKATAAEAVTALEMAETQLEELNATVESLQNERAALETQVQEAVERAAAAEMAGAEAAAAAAQAAQAAVSQQAQGEVDSLRASLETANNEYAALFNRVSELEAAHSAGGGPGTTEVLREEITTLQAAIAEYQVECQRYAERVQMLEAAAAANTNSGGDSKQQALMRRAEGAESQVAQLQVETATLRAQVESERTRAAQLEAFAERQRAAQASAAGSSHVGDKKDEDNSLDMEAAALAGGSAFRPLVGLVRSLPAPLSHPLVVQGARELDRGMVALDARPHIRAAIIFYIVLLHIMLLI